MRRIKNNKIICFSGPDGAGKSTVFLMAERKLRKEGYNVFVLRQYQVVTAFVLNVKKYLKGESKSLVSEVGRLGYSEKKRDRDTGNFLWKFKRFIGLVVGIIDINIFGRMYVYIKSKQGYTVLVEQAPLDVFVKRHRPQFKFMEIVFAKIFPKPSVSILCTADPYKIVDRKPELTVEEIEDYYIKINDLYGRSKNFNKVDLSTDQSLERTESDLETIIFMKTL